MSVTITASQAVAGDIVRDAHGNLWVRQAEPHNKFSLVFVFSPDVLVGDTVVGEGDELTPEQMDAFAPLELTMRDGQPVGDQLPPPRTLPRIVEFTWYLQENSLWENRDSLARELGFTISDELLKKMGNPFCEVTLFCQLDTETGQVNILSAK